MLRLWEGKNEAAGAVHIIRRENIHVIDDDWSGITETKQVILSIKGSSFRERSNEKQTCTLQNPVQISRRWIDAAEFDFSRLHA